MMSSSPEDHAPLKCHLEILRKHFGHTSFRPMQWKIIHSVMEDKKDNCVIMATGYGKSLCYQYPAVFKHGLSIIICPLISLMEDQVQALEVANIPSCYLGSAQTKTGDVIDKLMEGFYRLVYLTPEYASGESGMALLKQLHKTVNVTLLAIDEAHCVSQWGHDFRPAYKHLGKLRSALPFVPILAVTATATDVVKNDIIQMLGLRSPEILSSGFDRPNLYFKALKKSTDPFADISKVLLHERKIFNIANGSVIIYCLTKKITDSVADALNSNNIKCHSYHAGLSLKTRKFVHEQFVKDEIKVLVATIAFGMGIDKPNVRCVIHYGASSVMEGYYQEAGRAGRDGNPSLCILYHSPTDFSTHENLREFGSMSTNAKLQQESLNKYMKHYVSSRNCRRHLILSYFDKELLPPSSHRTDCCDNCTRMATTPKDSLRYEGINENGLYDFSKDTELFLNAIDCFHPKAFGVGMIIALLKGSKTKKLNTSYLTTAIHGAGSSKSDMWWKQIAFLLEQENFIKKERRNFGNIGISVILKDRNGETWLRSRKRGKADPVLLMPTADIVACLKTKSVQPLLGDSSDKIDLQQFVRETPSTSSKSNESSSVVVQLNEYEEKLMAELMKVRHILARTGNIMPYVVASDIALQQMAVKRPLTLTQLVDGKFDGMSDSKISKFGSSFVSQIKQFCVDNPQPVQTIDEILSQHPLPLTSVGQLPSFNLSQRQSLSLFNEGKTIQEVAAIRKLETSTIMNHFTSAMRSGCKIDIRTLITAPKLKCIIDVIKSAPINRDMSKLGPIKNNCPPVIKYDEIKLTIAYLEVRNHLDDLNCVYKDDYSLGEKNGIEVFECKTVSPFGLCIEEQQTNLSNSPSVTDSVSVTTNTSQNEVLNVPHVGLITQKKSDTICIDDDPWDADAIFNTSQNEVLNVPHVGLITQKSSEVVCIDDDPWDEDDIFAENIDQLDKDMNRSIDCTIKKNIVPDVIRLDIEGKLSIQSLNEVQNLDKINTTRATQQTSETLHVGIDESSGSIQKRKVPDWQTDAVQAKRVMKNKMAKNSLFN